MAKPIPKKKSHPKFHKVGRVRAKHKTYKGNAPKPRELRSRGWMVAGFDTSMSSLAGAAVGYDATLKRMVGPYFTMARWSKEDHYFDRLKTAAKAHELIYDLQVGLGLELNLNEVYIAQEEPWPVGMVGKGASGYLKQQAEISGAFLGGLIRYGFKNIEQMNSIRWRKTVADQLGITTHHSKWKDPKLATVYNCKPADTGKFRTKQWALDGIDEVFTGEIPDWPDIIESSKLGKIPRPESSKAKAVQPDDRYDALAIMWTHFQELVTEETLIFIGSEPGHGYWEMGDY